MNVAAIREKRAAKVTEMRALLSKAEGEKRPLTEAEKTAFDSLKGEVQTLEGDEQRALFMQEAERRQAGEPVTDKAVGELESRVSLLKVLQAGIEGRSLNGAEAEYAAEAERRTGRKAQGVFVPTSLFEKRATDTTAAPELVGTDHRADLYIGPLRANLIARRLGVRVLSGLRGDVSVPKYGSGTSVGWVAEGGALAESGMSFDAVTLKPKHAGGYVTMSRQLIQQSAPSIEALVRDDLAAVMAKAIDSALIKGGGTNEPTGVLEATGTQAGSLATLSWANVLAMKGKLESANIDPASASWLMAPAAAEKLRGTLKEAGIAGYLMEGDRVAELPAHVTTQVPVNSDDSNNVILGDWSQAMLGIWSEADLLVNPYSDSVFKTGAVMVRIMSTVDIAFRHPQAFVIAADLA